MVDKDFIYSSQIDLDICDGLIDFFEEHPLGDLEWESEKFGTFYGSKTEGKVGGSEDDLSINHDIKRSTDLSVPHFVEDERIQRYQHAKVQDK